MKINIICNDKNWIYSKFIVKLGLYSKNKIYLNSMERCDLDYCIPYYDFKSKIRPTAIWASHQESTQPLRDKFISAARQADCSISHSKKYADLLKESGIKNVIQIMPGIDLDLFRLENIEREKSDKLIIGWIGRSYSSSIRKNEIFLQKISKLNFIDLRITGGEVKEIDMPNFYKMCNLIVSTSTIEGGPMSHLESAAIGKPFLCFDNVGTSRELNEGTIRVQNEQDFIDRITDFWKNKEWLGYNTELRQKIRSQVEGFTWKEFARKHDDCFEQILKK